MELTRRDDAVIFALHGDIDIANIDRVQSAIVTSLDHVETRYVIDLSPTTFLDSVGIRMLFFLASRLRTRRKQLHIAVPRGSNIARVLEITDVPRVIPTHPDVQSALEASDDLSL